MANLSLTPRDVARELARRYSTMTHDELDVLEQILIPRLILRVLYIMSLFVGATDIMPKLQSRSLKLSTL